MSKTFNVRSIILVALIAFVLFLQQPSRSTAQSDIVPAPGDWAGTFMLPGDGGDGLRFLFLPGSLEVAFQVAEDGKSLIGTAIMVTNNGTGGEDHVYGGTWVAYADHGLFSGQVAPSGSLNVSFSGRFVSSTQVEGIVFLGAEGKVIATGDWQAEPVTSP